MYVCMYVNVYIRACNCKYVHVLCVYLHACECIYIHVCMYVDRHCRRETAFSRKYMCMYVCVCVCVCVCACGCACVFA